MIAKVTTPPLRIELSGTPREIGLQHGTLLAQQIRGQIRVYDTMFRRTSNLDWDAVRAVSREYQTTLQRLTPDLYVEMEGIAEGAGLDVLDIVALNCRSEIALGLFSDGCSSLGWKMGVTTEPGEGDDEDTGKVVLAQNWDWTARVKENCVIMSIEQPGKPKIFICNEAGLVGKIGFNSSSVGVCMNAIRAKPTDSSKIPVHVALRVCLNSNTASEAIAQLDELGSIASTQHILLADAEGPISMELSPRGDVHIRPKDGDNGIVCHTNHLLENRYVKEYPWLAGSPIRLGRMRKLSAGVARTTPSGTDVTGDVLRNEIFSDTFNAPQAICCQEDPARPIETRSSTLFCIAMKFGHGLKPTAEVVWGRPGSGEEGPVITLGGE
ncbi:isopenicillin-N N-acyltransferase [Capronia coronata CBS 617.96]|uniref:Isopenicillin-N N-acyltransferase n=1 Tax=Capronia coronata CBS 617.96 TaxID=1182541 RepID=W9YM42_9EURO|nr:isopenicillin-N N-acyltransferase [Capronia coronata CBS 617.96]EXJ90306.1 isopenicillin-N N-acyltransferase [Capronia coronata CBS 617.96]